MEKTHYEVFIEICKRRKSVRSFSNRTVDQQTINKIIECVKTAPYASGLKNWDVIVVSEKETIQKIKKAVEDKIIEISREIRDDLKDPFLSYSKSFTFFDTAPIILIFEFRVSPVISALLGKNLNESQMQWERDNFTKSISCATTITLLAAESLGLGSCYMTGPTLAGKEIAEIVHLKPGREIGAIVPIGYVSEKQ